MTNNQLTDERIKELMHIGRYSYHVVCGREIADICTALEELQERRKADSEPVVFTDERNLHHIAMGRETSLIWGKQNSETGDVPLYRHAQPALDGEPVAWKYEEYVYVSGLGHLWREKLDCEFPGIECGTLRGVVPLYRHAQQPVVGYVPLGDSPYDIPYSMPSNLREFIDQEIGILFSDDDAQGVWIACRRAAMLNGGKS